MKGKNKGLILTLVSFVLILSPIFSIISPKTCKDGCYTGLFQSIYRSGGILIIGDCQQQFQYMPQDNLDLFNNADILLKVIYENNYYSIVSWGARQICVTEDDKTNLYGKCKDVLKQEIGCERVHKKDEEGNYVVLRNPKLAVAYGIEPPLALRSDIFVLENLAQIEDFLFHYIKYPPDHRPAVYFRVGFPAELFGYLYWGSSFWRENEDFMNIQVPLLKNPVVPIFNNSIGKPSYYGVISITDYLKWFNWDNSTTDTEPNSDMGINVSKFEGAVPYLITLQYSKENPYKITIGSVVGKVVFENYYEGEFRKIEDDMPYYLLVYPKGFSITFIDTPSCEKKIDVSKIGMEEENIAYDSPSFENLIDNIDVIRTYAEYKLAKPPGIQAVGISEEFYVLDPKITDTSSNVRGCVYYYKDRQIGAKDGKPIFLYTGKLALEESYFVPVKEYYYWNGSVLKRFEKNEVYLCKNGKWMDLDENETECINFMNKFYNVYNTIDPIYFDKDCSINKIDEHKVWYREYKEGKVIKDLNLAVVNEKYAGFSDCINENKELVENGQVTEDNKLCSAGILTPVFNEIDKFYIRKFPENVTFSFTLQNFALEPIELTKYELKGLPETWSYKFFIENTTIKSGEEFKVEITIFNYEEDSRQKNLTLYLEFVLKDNKTNLIIPFEIPFRLQFTKEYLVQAKANEEIIYDNTKGKTNNITLEFYYEFFGKLEEIRTCDETEITNGKSNSDLCKYVVVDYKLPSYCQKIAESTLQYKLSTNDYLYPTLTLYCTKPITEEDKLTVCSKTILLSTTGNIDLFDGIDFRNDAHCTQISLKATSFIKDFLLTTQQIKENENYYLIIDIENIGNMKLKGVIINITDINNNCNLDCYNNENCQVINNKLYYKNMEETIEIGGILSKKFLIKPTGICKLDVSVTLDDPITKNTTIIINPYLEEGKIKPIVKGNSSLYGVYVLILAFIFFLIGVYKIREEFS